MASLRLTFGSLMIRPCMRKMKKGSILINCGRGTAIVTNDLIKLTQENWFRGVALDVTDPEPLPKNNVLWNMPYVFITPHVSGRYNMRETYESMLKIIATRLAQH